MTASWQVPLFAKLVTDSWKDIIIYQYHTLSGSPYHKSFINRRDISSWALDGFWLSGSVRDSNTSKFQDLGTGIFVINFDCMIKFIEAKHIVIHLVDLVKN